MLYTLGKPYQQNRLVEVEAIITFGKTEIRCQPVHEGQHMHHIYGGNCNMNNINQET